MYSNKNSISCFLPYEMSSAALEFVLGREHFILHNYLQQQKEN